MANTINTAGGSFADMSRFTELRQRLFFLIGALVVYRIGTYIPVPGIDPNALQNFFEEQSGTILSMFNMFSGGALERLSIFALGIFPYISCSIVMQLASATTPALKELKSGCRFCPRSGRIFEQHHLEERPDFKEVNQDHWVEACPVCVR